MAMAMNLYDDVSGWGGALSARRDKALIRQLAQQVRAVAL